MEEIPLYLEDPVKRNILVAGGVESKFSILLVVVSEREEDLT